MAAYNSFLADVAPEADKFKQQQQAASAKQVCSFQHPRPAACTPLRADNAVASPSSSEICV